MSIHGKNTVLCIAACIVMSATAETDYSGYVQLKGVDKLNSNSWRSKGYWSDQIAPSPGKNYFVPQGKELWFQRDSNADAKRIWQGGKLAIAGILHTVVNASSEYSPHIPDLTLCAGGMVRVSNYGTFSKDDDSAIGVVTVEGTADNPSVISHHYANSKMSSRSWLLNASFKGDAEKVLVLERPEINFEGSQCFSGELCTLDASTFGTYRGTVRMQGSTMVMRPVKNTVFNWPDTLLSVCAGARLDLFHKDSKVTDATTDAYLGALSAENAGICWKYVSSDGGRVFPLVHLKGAFGADSGSKVMVAASRYDLLCALTGSNGAGNRADAYSIVRMPSSSSIAEEDVASVAVAVTNANENFLPVKLRIAGNVDGYRDIVLSASGVSVMTNRESQTSSGGAFCEGHGGDWTTGEVPSPGSAIHYWLGKSTYVTDDILLPESILTVANTFNCTGGESFEFKEMNLCGGNMLFWSGSEERTFKAGKINVYSSQEIASSTPYVIFNAEICGKGTLTLRNNDNGYGKMRFDRENTNYAGRVIVTQQGPNSDKTAITPYKFTLYVNNAFNLGGKYAGEDTYRAITLSKFPIFNFEKDVTFAEPTRGILIQEGARFTVSGGTVTVSNQVTYAGLLEKRGSGTLELAGTVRFIDGGADTLPKATTNVIDVIAGKVRISSKTAADGLEIRFAKGTKLLIPADTEAGYYNVKWDAPLSVDTDNGKLPVVVEGLDAAESANVKVPLCTFNATAAANIPVDVFDVSASVKGVRLKSVEKVANEDGSVSYVATFGSFGSRILLR